MKPYYQDDRCTIYHGDCREVLPTLKQVDLLLTDPPYGIAHRSNGQRFKKAEPVIGDEDKQLAEWLFDSTTQPLAMFFSPYAPIARKWRSVLVWDKGAHVGIGGDRATCWKRDFELIGIARNLLINGKRDSAVLRYTALSPPPTGHVCEKPPSIIRYLIGKLSCSSFDVVVDPFMGSGTTLVAAKLEGRRSIGIEINERYCEIAANRLLQGVLF